MLILALEVIVQPQIQFHRNFFIALFSIFIPLCSSSHAGQTKDEMIELHVRTIRIWTFNCGEKCSKFLEKSRIGGHRRSYSYYLFQSLKSTLFVNSFRMQRVAKELGEKYGSFVLFTNADHYWKLFLIFWAPPIDII